MSDYDIEAGRDQLLYDVLGAFANGDQSVINWNGENYFKACGHPVTGEIDKGQTLCVKRVDHPGDIHEDIDGVRKTVEKHRYVIAVSVPFDPSGAGFEEVQTIMHKLRDELGDKEGRLVYNAIRDTADQLIMILEGDG